MVLNRMNDYVFKWIFGNRDRKDLLLSFINSVLTDGGEEDIIRDIELIDRELDPAFYLDKASRLDILGETMDGQKINLEVQTSNDGDIDQRSMYYWAKIYQEQLLEGMKYKDLRPTIAINVLNFNYFATEKYHSKFAVLEEEEHYRLNDNLQMHFIEMKKWTKLSIKTRNRLERWLLFLANNNPIELEEIAMKDATMTRALEAEKMFLSSKEARYIYDQREKARRDWFSSIATAEERGEKKGIAVGIKKGRKEGFEEGRKKGIEKSIEKMAINLLQIGIALDKIQQVTGLDVKALEKLKEKTFP